MEVTEDEIFTLCRGSPLKALLPISLRPLPISTAVRLEQPAKALLPIVRTDLGSVTFVMEELK